MRRGSSRTSGNTLKKREGPSLRLTFVLDPMRKLTHSELLNRQRDRLEHPRLPLAVVLNNIRSLYNVGAVFRTADGAGIEKVWLCGCTGAPPAAQIHKTALGAELRVPWEQAESAAGVVRRLKARGYQIVLLEQTDAAVPYQEFSPRFPSALVIGNEIEGVADELVEDCDAAVEIEMAGMKNSLNVAVAFGIVAYHWRYLYQAKGRPRPR